MLNECKRYLDTNIYRSFNILKTNYAQYFKHFDKGFKISIGVKIDNELNECIKMMSYSYRTNDINEKIIYANKTYDLLYDLEIDFKGLFESYKCISQNQYTSLCFNCGKIEDQLIKWINSNNKKLNKPIK